MLHFLQTSGSSKAGLFEFIAEGKKTSNYKWDVRTLRVVIDPGVLKVLRRSEQANHPPHVLCGGYGTLCKWAVSSVFRVQFV